jgi:hypothetical protein
VQENYFLTIIESIELGNNDGQIDFEDYMKFIQTYKFAYNDDGSRILKVDDCLK